MNFKITLRESDVRGMINRTFGPGIRRQILGAMGAKLIEISRRNFGVSGPDRPNQWEPLSPRYARKVKRSYATLYVSGDLFRDVTLNVNDDRAVVTFEDEKASWHQFGEGKNKKRPFMPLWGNQLSPLAERQIITAGQLKLQSLIRGGPQSSVY